MRSEVNCQLPETDRFYSPSDLNPTEHQVELKTVWQKTLRRAKVPYFRIYDLRSTYATRLSAGGVAAESVTQLQAPAPCPSSRSKAVTARRAVARPLGPSGVLRQRRRCNADGEVPLIRSLLASLLYAAEVHGFGSCPMSDWIRKSHFKLS